MVAVAAAHPLRAYEFVSRPYATVCDALASEESAFRRATDAAASRADSLVQSLRIDLPGIEVGSVIDLAVEAGERSDRRTTFKIGWAAPRPAALFSSMSLTLGLLPLTPTETQIELRGTYTAPLGLVGAPLDTALLHCVADATVHRFVAELARLLRAELPEP